MRKHGHVEVGSGNAFPRTLSSLRTRKYRQLLCLAFLSVVLPTGLLWRLAPLHLSSFAFKYGGSALWAMAVYGAVAFGLPRWSSVRVAVLAALIAAGVEWLKRLYWEPLDRFRETLAGKLLLGRYFTWGAIAAYGLAIAFVFALDATIRKDEPPVRAVD